MVVKDKPKKEEKPKPMKGEPPKQEQLPPPQGGPGGDTVERPKRDCDCKTSEDIYTQIGTLDPVNNRPLRVRITIQSVVVCDPGTPNNCFYQYTATTNVEIFRPQQGARPAGWDPFAGRKVFITSFTVQDDVNKTEKPDRVDRESVTLGEWFPRAPQKEKTRIVLELAPSVRDKWRATVTRDIELCVPKLENPKCP